MIKVLRVWRVVTGHKSNSPCIQHTPRNLFCGFFAVRLAFCWLNPGTAEYPFPNASIMAGSVPFWICPFAARGKADPPRQHGTMRTPALSGIKGVISVQYAVPGQRCRTVFDDCCQRMVITLHILNIVWAVSQGIMSLKWHDGPPGCVCANLAIV